MSPRYDVPKAAPEPLRLVQRFVNTIDVAHALDWIATPEELSGWLVEVGIVVDLADVEEADVAHARELREALRALLHANNGAPVDPSAVATVNRAAGSARMTPELDPEGRVVFEPYGRAVDAALGRIVATAFDAIVRGEWPRLKACPECHWAFYDYSRNRSAGWCSMSICGNRLKTRRYRARTASR